MKNYPIKAAAARAALVACAFAALAGCGRKPEPRKTYAPLAPEGTAIAAVYETKGLADNPMMDFLIDCSAKANGKIAEAAAAKRPELAATLAKTDAASLKKRELENIRMFDWVAFAMKKPAFTAELFDDDDAVLPFPAAAIVYASSKPMTFAELEKKIKDDFREGTAALDENSRNDLCEFFSENFDVADDTAAGCAIRKFTLKDNDITHEFLAHVSGLAPCYGMFDDSLFIIASSPEAFAETVALYKGEAAKSADAAVAADFALGGKEQLRYGIYGLQGLLGDFLGDNYDKFDDLTRGLVKPMKSIRFSCAIDGAAMSATTAMRIAMANEEAARTFSSTIENSRGMIAMAAGMATMRIPALAPAVGILNNFRTSGENGVCSIEIGATKADIEAIDLPAAVDQIQALVPQGGDDEEDEEDGGEDEDDGDVDMSDVVE